MVLLMQMEFAQLLDMTPSSAEEDLVMRLKAQERATEAKAEVTYVHTLHTLSPPSLYFWYAPPGCPHLTFSQSTCEASFHQAVSSQCASLQVIFV